MIICAAMKLELPNKTHVICGHRHGDCFQTFVLMSDEWHKATKTQGFIDHKGRFLDRKSALQHALECGQLSETTRWYQQDHGNDELYSEDLY